jgi:hypothetical protein
MTRGPLIALFAIGLVVVALVTCDTKPKPAPFGQRAAFHRCALVTQDLHQPLTAAFVSQGGNACWQQYNLDWPVQ